MDQRSCFIVYALSLRFTKRLLSSTIYKSQHLFNNSRGVSEFKKKYVNEIKLMREYYQYNPDKLKYIDFIERNVCFYYVPYESLRSRVKQNEEEKINKVENLEKGQTSLGKEVGKMGEKLKEQSQKA